MPGFLSIRDAAAFLGIKPHALHERVRTGRISATRVGPFNYGSSKLFLKLEDLESMKANPPKLGLQGPQARNLLIRYLKDGPRPAGEIIKAAKALPFSKATLYRAAHRIGVKSLKLKGRRGRPSQWALPTTGAADDWDRHAKATK